MSGVYRTAQVCKNGHVITSNISYSEFLADFYPDCGAKTISSCLDCKTPIRGDYDIPDVIDFSSSYQPPAYCYHCGKPFPWTESKLNAIADLLDMQNQLTEEEKKRFISCLPTIFTETSQSEVTAFKLRALFKKLPSEIGRLVKNIIIDVLSESVKKVIFP